MGAVLLRLDALDDEVLDIIETRRGRRGFLAGAALGTQPADPEVRGDLGHVEGGEHVERRAVVVLLPFEAADQPGECGAYSQITDPMSQSGLCPPQPAIRTQLQKYSNNAA